MIQIIMITGIGMLVIIVPTIFILRSLILTNRKMKQSIEDAIYETGLLKANNQKLSETITISVKQALCDIQDGFDELRHICNERYGAIEEMQTKLESMIPGAIQIDTMSNGDLLLRTPKWPELTVTNTKVTHDMMTMKALSFDKQSQRITINLTNASAIYTVEEMDTERGEMYCRLLKGVVDGKEQAGLTI